MGTFVPGVVGPLPVGEVPRPVPPGVVVVAARDVGRATRRLVRVLDAASYSSPEEARHELARRRAASVGPHLTRLDECRAEATTARRDLEEALASLRPGLAGVRPEDVADAAGAVYEAREVVGAARAGLGPRPALDEALARSAHEAQGALEEARQARGTRLPEAVSLLTMANCGAGVLVLGRMFSEAFDAAFVLVAALPLAALGYAGSVVVRDVNRCRRAARRRWMALRAMDLCTMAGLASREAEVRGWEERSGRAHAAGARLAEAEAAWAGLVGPGLSVEAAPNLMAALEEVAELDRRAQEAEAAWVEAAAAIQCAEDLAGLGTEPLVVADRRPAQDHQGRALAALAEAAGLASVVVVRPVVAVAHSAPPEEEPEEPAGDQPAASAGAVPPIPAAHHGVPLVPAAASSAVVDLRQRVLTGLLRLRSRPVPRDRRPPGSVASGG